MKCPKCSREASEGCIICPYCLSPLEAAQKKTAVNKKNQTAKKTKKGWIVIPAVIAALLAAAALFFFLSGCSAANSGDAVETSADIPDLAGLEWYEDGSFAVFDSDPTLYAGSPIVGTWVLLEDYEDGYHDRDNIAEYTSDGYVYEWYGDGLGYYNPLCTYDYDGETLVYHYFTELGTPDNYDAVFSCIINDTMMTTTDQQGITSQFIRISPEINLSVDEVTVLYPQD